MARKGNKKAKAQKGNEGSNGLLFESVRLGMLAEADRALRAGADINARDGKGGTPLHIAVAMHFEDTARLLIEKGAIWQRFNKDRFWDREKCMIIHGGGQPPRGVRRLVYRMYSELKLPVYVLVDNDPWGYYIYSVVKQGSINLAFESQRMAIPDAKFLGLSSHDAETYGLPRNVGIKLNDKDISRAKELAGYPWFQKKEWQQEILYMLKSGLKYELDALANKDFRFLTTDYLPAKLKKKDWLD
jgi:DNA topoisomerase-6 subunit A